MSRKNQKRFFSISVDNGSVKLNIFTVDGPLMLPRADGEKYAASGMIFGAAIAPSSFANAIKFALDNKAEPFTDEAKEHYFPDYEM
jgi:hypothetical protein